METDLRRLATESDDVRNRAEVNRSDAAQALERIKELEAAQEEVQGENCRMRPGHSGNRRSVGGKTARFSLPGAPTWPVWTINCGSFTPPARTP